MSAATASSPRPSNRRHSPIRTSECGRVYVAMLGVILGGRIGYVLFYGTSFWAKDILYPFKIWDGGMSFHGGMLGVMTACALFAWRRHRNVADVLDFTVPLPGLGRLFGILGDQPWTVYRFLRTAHAELGGSTGLDAMKEGRIDVVLGAARNQVTGAFA